MKLPWGGDDEKDEELDRLRSKIEELENEVESYRKRFEAEKERRSKLSRQKQGAEEELNILKQKIESEKQEEEYDNDGHESIQKTSIGLDYFQKLVSRLQTIKSEEEGLVTICSRDKLSDHPEISEIKNSLASEKIANILNRQELVMVSDSQELHYVFTLRPFYSNSFTIDNRFNLDKIQEFIEREKHWVLVELGHTKILKEKNGDYEIVEEVKSRVDRKHSKGGFSQQRFERKRDEQVRQHLEQVEEALPDGEVYILGDNRYCQDLDGKYLGSFDSSSPITQELYRPRIHK